MNKEFSPGNVTGKYADSNVLADDNVLLSVTHGKTVTGLK